MTEQEAKFRSVSESLPETDASQMFGKYCYKVIGKPFVSFFQDSMVFKLRDEAHARALGLEGAHLFDPSGKGRAMKEWVQVPYEHAAEWDDFAKHAYDYVKELFS